MLLEGRSVLLGVCGGIAAYKACELARLLLREGARVQVVLTPAAAQFVTPLTFAALTNRPAPVDEFAAAAAGGETYSHLELTREIDCFAIVPATANTLAQLAIGSAANLLTACYVACQAPVVIAPAMNARMWRHPAVQANVDSLQRRGHLLVPPGTGELACGDTGAGRLAELTDIFAAIVAACADRPAGPDADEPALAPLPAGDLAGRRIIVTAGGTREYLDPVRFITNASSGRLGLNVVSELARRGARVELLETGIDVDIALEAQLSARETVRTAFDLRAELRRRLPGAAALVMLAAVADYSPAEYRNTKHKKDGSPWVVEFVETPDILAEAAAHREPGQVLVGVSLEDTDWLARGMKKARAKHVDMLLAVELGADLPFGDSRLNCALVDAERELVPAGRRAKAEVARLLGDWLATRLDAAQE